MSNHQVYIIPEINGSSEICDHTDQTAKTLLSNKNHVIIFFTTLPPQSLFNFIKNHHVYVLKILPFNRFNLIFKLNSYITLNILYIYVLIKYKVKPIYWIFYPSLASLLKFSFRPKKMVFDILDGFKSRKSDNLYLLKNSTIVSVMTPTLLNYYRTNFGTSKYILTNPASHLENYSKNIDIRISRFSGQQNIIGYIGGINERIDFKLLLDVIVNTPKVDYIFAGPVNHDGNVPQRSIRKELLRLFSQPNVYHIGILPKNQIRNFLKVIKAGIIPYQTSLEFNRLSFPLKAIEYLLAQKVVISTPIDELAKYPQLFCIAHTSKEFIQKINSIIGQNNFSPDNNQLIKFLKKNSWKNKIQAITNKLDYSN